MANSPHPFAQYIRILGRGKKGSRSLDFEEARQAMTMIVQGQVDPLQLGAFLMLLRFKEESAEELAGFARAVREAIALPNTLPTIDLDWPSYAGKRQHHPWYLLSALALADSGCRVLMHGSGGHTAGRLYSEDALAQLGISANREWSQVNLSLRDNNFAFIPTGVFCPQLEYMLQLKPMLGLRSVANSLARLANPAGASASMISIFHPRYGAAQQQALSLLGQKNAAIFKGEGGEAERKPDASCDVLELSNGRMQNQKWPRLEHQRSAKVSPNTRALLTLWRTDNGDSYGRQAVIGTLAIATRLLGKAAATEPAMELAESLWESRNRSRL